MAAATTATATGMAMLLCVVLGRRCGGKQGEEDGKDEGRDDDEKRSKRDAEMERRLSRRPAEPPSTWQEAVATVADTIRFTYSETLGRWPIGDLAFGIKHHMRKQGLQVSSVFAGSHCLKIEGPALLDELIYLSRLLGLCIVLSKKPFSFFLKFSDYCPEDIIFRKNKAGLLKPSFTILRDKSSKSILLIVRGMHSIKDTLTAATGLVVPFSHSILDECGVSKVVLGYAHFGMVSAAHWIAKCATPYLLKAAGQYPAYKIKIVGNSLGAGIAALLTYILRECIDFSSTACIAFAPAACMTWDLAESGQTFVDTIINNSDLVPTFSIVSADNLRLEVAASSWLSDFRDQFQQPFTSCARIVSCKSQDFLKNAQQAALAFARCMDCLGIIACHEEGSSNQVRKLQEKDTNSAAIKLADDSVLDQTVAVGSCSNQYCNGTEEEAEELTESELWLELEKELKKQDEEMQTHDEEMQTHEETVDIKDERFSNLTERSKQPKSTEEIHFFPPGRIRHIVAAQASEGNTGKSVTGEPSIGMYETPRYLYGKIRLSPNMIKDHYMPAYKNMIELMIENLRKKESS